MKRPFIHSNERRNNSNNIAHKHRLKTQVRIKTMNYRLVTILLWPVFFIYTLKTALRDKSLRYFFQRLGFKYPRQTNKTIWIHCASVGETNTYFALHLKLLENNPDTQFIITTNTTTGANTVKRHNSERTMHCYLPVESSFAIKRFLAAFKPEQCIIMETEIWPLLYQHCHLQQIPICIINARLSHRTLGANNWIKSVYKKALGNTTKILCKSEQELNNFKTLGANTHKLQIAGNLKFTHIENRTNTKTIDLNHRPYCVAASTHNNEEQQLADVWAKLSTDRLLVIAPRHPNRSQQIQKQLSDLNIEYAVRSKRDKINSNTKIYLADTLGELNDFMVNADFVFIGGSLIEHGGQNLLEPARLGKTVICGPYMFNFADEVELLLKHDACIQVNSIDDLKQSFSDCLKRPEHCASIGLNAKDALDQQIDILENYLSLLAIQR